MIWRIVIGVTAAVFAGSAGYMVGDRQPPLVRYWGQIVPENPQPGSNVHINWDLQWTRFCPGKVYRRIVDSHKIVWDFEPFDAVYTRARKITEESRRLDLGFQLPRGIAPGPAEYFSIVVLQCNWLHRFWPIIVDEPTLHFDVGSPPVELH